MAIWAGYYFVFEVNGISFLSEQLETVVVGMT